METAIAATDSTLGYEWQAAQHEHNSKLQLRCWACAAGELPSPFSLGPCVLEGFALHKAKRSPLLLGERGDPELLQL